MKKGFTLIEMMVAVSIFAIAMMIGVGALLSLVEADKRAQAINSVMQNVNAAVEGMSRGMRVGITYHCENALIPQADVTQPLNCPNAPGGTLLAFEGAGGSSSNANDQVVYRLNGTQIERSLQSGASGSWVALTAPEVSIDSLQFYVIGAGTEVPAVQPRIVMNIRGSAKVPGGTTTFTIQSSITQRLLDI